MSKEKRILVLGGGFGGLQFCKQMKLEGTRVKLVDRKNHHLFQPLLYQVATCGLAAPQIAHPLRWILRRRSNVETYLDTVEKISLEEQKVFSKEHTYEYDYLVLGLGARTGYFGNNHWAEHTYGLKTLQDAIRIRSHVLRVFEEAEMEKDPVMRRRKMTIVVVGGGPTGVEMAGALAELSRHVFRRNFRNIDPAQTRIMLVEASDRVLGMYSPELSEKARKQIEELGVEVHCGKPVTDIRKGEMDLNGETIHAETIIWGAGVEAVPLTRELGVPLDRGGRIKVEPDCSLPGYPNVFAIGDIVNLVDARGKPVPGVSPAALQMGSHVAKLITREIQSGTTQTAANRKAFVYRNKGSMATIGRSRAIAEIGKLKLSGWPAWAAWLIVHLIFLVGFRNKIGVLMDWTYSYFTYRRGARVIAD